MSKKPIYVQRASAFGGPRPRRAEGSTPQFKTTESSDAETKIASGFPYFSRLLSSLGGTGQRVWNGVGQTSNTPEWLRQFAEDIAQIGKKRIRYSNFNHYAVSNPMTGYIYGIWTRFPKEQVHNALSSEPINLPGEVIDVGGHDGSQPIRIVDTKDAKGAHIFLDREIDLDDLPVPSIRAYGEHGIDWHFPEYLQDVVSVARVLQIRFIWFPLLRASKTDEAWSAITRTHYEQSAQAWIVIFIDRARPRLASVDPTPTITQSYSRRVGSLLSDMNIIERPSEPGKVRVRWKCCCGAALFDDYQLTRADDLREILERLNYSSGTRGAVTATTDGQDSHTGIIGKLSGIAALFKGRVSRTDRDQSPVLPQSEPQNAPGAAAGASSSARFEQMHLLVCMPGRGLGVSLCQERVDDSVSNRKLFDTLKKSYEQHRGHLRSVFSPRRIVGVKFVEFSLLSNLHVNLRKHDGYCKIGCSCLPPIYPVRLRKTGYKYSPCPPEHFPPLGPNAMAHYLTNPSHVKEGENWILALLPKKLNGELRERPNGQVPGWGIYVQEDLHWNRIWILMAVVLALGSAMFGILWSVFEQDIQGAFGVASWWISLCSVCLGYLATRDA